MKFFLLLITLQLSLISTFFTSNVALAVKVENNNKESNQTTINLNKSQLKELTESINNTKQESINIKPTDGEAFIIKIQEDDKKSFIQNPIFSGLFGAILGLGSTLLVWRITDDTNDRKQRISNTFELAKDWDSQDMRESRTLAWKKFSQQRACYKNFNYYYESEDSQDTNYAINMLRVVDFFDRIYFLEQENLIDKKTAKAIFSEPFTNWNKECFTFQHDALQNSISKVKLDIINTFAFTSNEGQKKLDWLLNESEDSKSITITNAPQKNIFRLINRFLKDTEQLPESAKLSSIIFQEIIVKEQENQYKIHIYYSQPKQESNTEE